MPRVAFQSSIVPEQLALLKTLGHAAEKAGAHLWAVGGAVRDALLERQVVDVDLASEAPAAELGRALAKATGGTLTSVTRFGTAKLHVGRYTFDLATARTETYPSPAVLPTVAFGSMADDLARRDFTVNAMAASLAPADFGELLDPHDGQRDLDAHLIRVLHAQSFRDDPTRAFRAVRYAVRLGFRIEQRTAGWMRRDAHLIARLTPARVRHELERMWSEPTESASMFIEAHRRGLLALVHPALGSKAVLDVLRRAHRTRLYYLALLGALTYPLSLEDAVSLERRLGFTKRQSSIALTTPRLRALERDIRSATPSQVHALMGGAPPPALTAVAGVSPDARIRKSIIQYFNRGLTRIPFLDGDDLLALGVPRGPAVGLVLRSLRAAQLDSKVRSRAGAERFVRRLIEEG